MASGYFIIQELTGGKESPPGSDGYFEWHDGHMPANPDPSVGYMAAPQGEWSMPYMQRVIRTDNPRSRVPSLQMLGAVNENISITGLWDDRFNATNFAEATRQRMNALISRGNPCIFRVGTPSTDWKFCGVIEKCAAGKIERDGAYSYAIDIIVSHEEITDAISGEQEPPSEAIRLMSSVDMLAGALSGASGQVNDIGAGPTTRAVDAAIDDIEEANANLSRALDASELRPVEQGIEQWSALATQFTTVHDRANDLLVSTIEARADLVLSALTVVNMIRFESWLRKTRVTAALTKRTAYDAAIAMRNRAKPNADRLYRPVENETLYDIAWKFYGDPALWHTIADRNGLRYYEMTGDEILSIPNRGLNQ